MSTKITNTETGFGGVSMGTGITLPMDRDSTDGSGVIATLYGRPLGGNRGVPLNLDWVADLRVNTSAVERRAATLGTRRTVKKDWQIAWLLRAISCMDLTTLAGDDTDERVRRFVRRRGGRFRMKW